jgi:phospholipase/lecithinase/hemolysin
MKSIVAAFCLLAAAASAAVSRAAAPHVKNVRTQTMFGDSYVFVVFQDATDLY